MGEDNKENNPCCKFKNARFTIKDADGNEIESGDGLGEIPVPSSKGGNELEDLIKKVQWIYDNAEGATSGDLATLGKNLTLEQRCWICNKHNVFGKGDPESLISFISGEGEDYDQFIADLDCTAFGFKSKSGNATGQGYTADSYMDKLIKGKCDFITASTTSFKNLCDIILVETIKSYLL